VGDGHGELDVAHALAADAGDGHLDAAAIAHDILVFDALVFAAGALVVAHRAEDLLAEKTARLGLEGAVVDGLGILDLTLRPGADSLRRGDGDRNVVELILVRTEDGTDFFAGVFGAHYDFAPNIVLSVSGCPCHRASLAEGGALREFDVETEGLHFLDQHVERFRRAGAQGVVALDERLVDLGAALTSSDLTVRSSWRVCAAP
jgi:hypothetical protein